MISIKIKPVEVKYNDTKDKSIEIMSLKTLENIIKKAIKESKDYVLFSFKGDEPTLAGLNFYKEVVALQKKYSRKKVKVMNSIQINGSCMDEKWAKFLKSENFLVNLSVNGELLLDRVSNEKEYNEVSIDKVIKTKNIMDKFLVSYNVITTITEKASYKASEVYKFYKENKIMFSHFVHYIGRREAEGINEELLTPNGYEKFLKDFFDLWYEDYKKGNLMSVRLFENICAILLGYEGESCELQGHCSIQNIIDINGNIYPCDFYDSEEDCLGNINKISFKELNKNNYTLQFISEEEPLTKCKQCKYAALCKGGCKRLKDTNTNEYYYCETFKNFYDYTIDRFIDVCKNIVKKK